MQYFNENTYAALQRGGVCNVNERVSALNSIKKKTTKRRRRQMK